jgi:hypothetical protein
MYQAYKPESYKIFMDKIHAENSDFAVGGAVLMM